MIGMPRFDVTMLETLGRVREVTVETTALEGVTRHRTIIWIVTVGDGAFVRSERGEAGRWYREARAEPEVILHVEGTAIPITAVLANDADTIEGVSDAFRRKYGKRSPGSTAAMLEPHTLATTMRLEPRDIPTDPTEAVAALLAEAEAAHGVYETTELDGVYDQDWPRWYAEYAVAHGMSVLLGRTVAADELGPFLANTFADFKAIEPKPGDGWAGYTARRISAEF